jgi:hypothetical protein
MKGGCSILPSCAVGTVVLVHLRAVWEEGCTCCPGRSAQTKSHRSGTYVTVELQGTGLCCSCCADDACHTQLMSSSRTCCWLYMELGLFHSGG